MNTQLSGVLSRREHTMEHVQNTDGAHGEEADVTEYNKPARVHKSMRIDAGLAAAVASLKLDGETEADAYRRALAAGVDALTAARSMESEWSSENAQKSLTSDICSRMLKEENARLIAQLAVKDEQLATMARIAEQAQKLHALTGAAEAAGTLAPRSERRGVLSRLMDALEKRRG